MISNLIDYEIETLRSLNGEDVPGLRWGAAMGEALENLLGGGYITRRMTGRGLEYVITDKGRAAITWGEMEG